MNLLLPTFKVVSVVFASASIITGTQAIVDPIGFSYSFGLPVMIVKDADESKTSPISNLHKPNNDINPIISYVSLMGVRQLATGITLLMFAYQKKWTEIATNLVILGIIVAGTDGIFLSRFGAKNQARFHAIPGALIAILAGVIIFIGA